MDDMFMIHLGDYIQHIDDKLMLYAMLRQMEAAVRKLPECQSTAEVRGQMEALSPKLKEMWAGWNIPPRYLVSGELDDLSDVMDEELMEPEDAGYYSEGSNALSEPGGDHDYGDELADIAEYYLLQLAERALEFARVTMDFAGKLTDDCDEMLSLFYGDEKKAAQ